MDEFETTDVDFDTEESADSSKVAIIALAGTVLVAAGTLAVVKYRNWRAQKAIEAPAETPELPGATASEE